MGNLPFLPKLLRVLSPGSQEQHGCVLLGAHPTSAPTVGVPEMGKEGKSQRSWSISQGSEKTSGRNLAPKQSRKTFGFR